MSSFEPLKFFATAPHPCSYFNDRDATTVFVEPDVDLRPDQIIRLAESGFRRSGRYIYKPHCDQCSACISVRIPVDIFKPKRRQLRTKKHNTDVSFSVTDPALDEERYDLYKRYINARHPSGDMFPPSPSQYESFLASTREHTFFLEARIGNRLIAVTLFDEIVGNSLSAIYSFFEPDSQFERRSLGRMMVLQLIELTSNLGIPYLYLGYWIQDSKKMDYKTEYRPIEMLINGRWIRSD